MAVVVNGAVHNTEEDPPIVNQCAYQVKIAYGEYQCMTQQEYSDYKAPYQSNGGADINFTPFLIGYGIFSVVIVIAFVIYKKVKGEEV